MSRPMVLMQAAKVREVIAADVSVTHSRVSGKWGTKDFQQDDEAERQCPQTLQSQGRSTSEMAGDEWQHGPQKQLYMHATSIGK